MNNPDLRIRSAAAPGSRSMTLICPRYGRSVVFALKMPPKFVRIRQNSPKCVKIIRLHRVVSFNRVFFRCVCSVSNKFRGFSSKTKHLFPARAFMLVLRSRVKLNSTKHDKHDKACPNSRVCIHSGVHTSQAPPARPPGLGPAAGLRPNQPYPRQPYPRRWPNQTL